MKHLKLFENTKSISSMKNIMKEYHELLKYFHPIVFQRYNEIAEDPELNYGQDIADVYGGDSYIFIHNIKTTRLMEMKMHDNKIFFTLEYKDSYDDEAPNTFYVPFTDKELEDVIMKFNAEKYNL